MVTGCFFVHGKARFFPGDSLFLVVDVIIKVNLKCFEYLSWFFGAQPICCCCNRLIVCQGVHRQFSFISAGCAVMRERQAIYFARMRFSISTKGKGKVRWNSVWRETVASHMCNGTDHSVFYDTRCSPLFHATRCFTSPPFLRTYSKKCIRALGFFLLMCHLIRSEVWTFYFKLRICPEWF